ncbi:MAG: hypothetical protein ABL880_04925 [Methylotenera sp.]
MKCRDTTFLVSEARDRELKLDEYQALNAHISECPLCQKASKQFDNLFEYLDDLFGKSDEV